MSRVIWMRSSYCGEAGACVEVAYRKSIRSGPYSDNCVEVADSDSCDLIHMRDSKDPDGPRLNFSRASWRAFIDAVKRDEFPCA